MTNWLRDLRDDFRRFGPIQKAALALYLLVCCVVVGMAVAL